VVILDEYLVAFSDSRERNRRDDRMKVSQWIGAVGLTASVLCGTARVASAAPAASCADGAVAVVTDDNGVQHEACVAVEASPAPQLATLSAPTESAPTTGSMPARATLPTTGVGTGGLVIAAVLVGSGSIVSLLSRRRPLGRRKGFRGRRVTP
jgi:hypothetical protein